VGGTEIEARLLRVIEVLLLERLERRRVTPLAVALVEEMAVVRARVAAAVTAAVGIGVGTIEDGLGVTLAARDVLVAAEQRHRGVLAVVVVELLLRGRLRRLPHALAVAALAREHVLALELVRLIVVVTARRTAQAIRSHVRLQAGLVLRLVTVGAVGLRVLAVERPATEVVVERLLTTGHRLPAHDVVGLALVVEVAGLALLAFDRRRRVIALAGRDTRLQVIVVVTVEALVVRDFFAAVDVAVVAVILGVEARMALRERAW